MTIMKSTRSWSIIIGITIVSCACAVAITYYLGWWNCVAIICIAMLVYAMISER